MPILGYQALLLTIILSSFLHANSSGQTVGPCAVLLTRQGTWGWALVHGMRGFLFLIVGVLEMKLNCEACTKL